MNTQKIVVGYDHSDAARLAAAWALDEAARTGAPVEFLYAHEVVGWMPAASMVPSTAVWPDAEWEQTVTAALEELMIAAKETHPTVQIEISVEHVDPVPTLIERSRHARLVVLGSRGHSAVAGLLGSVSVAVSAHAHCPVIVARPDAAPIGPVVAGVDDSPMAEPVLRFAFEQAAARGAGLRVVHAWRPVTGIWEETPLVTRAVTEAERRPFDALIARVAGDFPQVPVAIDALVEHPAAALTTASTKAQLLVVGSRGRGALRGILLGSVGQHLLRHSACTVAVVHVVKS